MSNKKEIREIDFTKLTDDEIWALEVRANKLFCGLSEDYLTKRQLIHLVRNERLQRALKSMDKQMEVK